MKPRLKKMIAVAAAATGLAVIAGLSAVVLVSRGVVLLNHPSRAKYPVRGVDVSHYQGEIDWDILAGQKISFAFIKATEGSSARDEYCAENLTGAQNSGLRAGAYHFFSFDSAGASQAENFIAAVPTAPGMLPPVVDLELYGGYANSPPGTDTVSAELRALLNALEEHYDMHPIIYSTEQTYALYLSDSFSNYDIWIRNVFTKPRLPDGREWIFWQYANRARLEGYSGAEKYIDLNVFNGTAEEFTNYGK
ncbi:MAG: glycoside hydrolase family 25 protein [Oscillospiraceae bacterium]|jgi:lysozyme|nr:glycoside hydrolase family 25 protein [Oscillospiraceae bacterium]